MEIVFQTIDENSPAVEYVSRKIAGLLASGKRVLWLVSGGSNITIATQVSSKLNGKQLENLTVALTDERYGMTGHADSNLHQLNQAGFRLDGAQLLPVLSNETLDVTVQNFADKLGRQLEEADYRIGLFGIGPDGHVAGLLPGSPAISSTELAAGFEDNYSGTQVSGVKRGIARVTMTAAAIAKLDEAVVYAIGEAKWPQLRQLADTIDVARQPAQLLKQVPKLTIFTDMKKESL